MRPLRSSVNFLYSSLISPKVTVWSNGTYSLLLNGTDEEDFALLLDFALELDCGVTLEEEAFTTLLLEPSFLTEDEDRLSSLEVGFTEELDSFVFSTEEDDSSLRSGAGAELLDSSPQATNKTATINNAKNFIFQI